MSPVDHAERSVARNSSTLAAFVIGLPLAVGVLAAVHVTDTALKRYFEHSVEIVEVVMFCCAVGALGYKALANVAQRAACRREMLPNWDGNAVSVGEAPALRAELEQNAGRLRNSLLARRIDAVLEFVSKRRDASGVDDQLRSLADNDNLALDNSYSLIRFITWAIPILGFLGTVLGITTAIGNVTNEIAEGSISSVTGGLSLAFDTTAVGLALTIATMFLSFLVERMEQSVLEYVDHYADVQLAHRFERGGAEHGDFGGALRQNAQILLEATGDLVRQQANVWAGALQAAEKRWAETGQRQQDLFAAALEQALEKTLMAHQSRLLALEQHVEKHSSALLGQLATVASAIGDMGREQQQSLTQVMEAVTAQTTALANLQDDGKQLIRLQDGLHQNLAALQGAGSFEQAVQSLTAAIHLMTAKVGPSVAGALPNRLGTRPGAAA